MTSAGDKQLVVWDVSPEKPVSVSKHDMGDVAVSGAWHPSANEVMVLLAGGELLTWTDVVPAGLLAPHLPVPIPQSGARALLFQHIFQHIQKMFADIDCTCKDNYRRVATSCSSGLCCVHNES